MVGFEVILGAYSPLFDRGDGSQYRGSGSSSAIDPSER